MYILSYRCDKICPLCPYINPLFCSEILKKKLVHLTIDYFLNDPNPNLSTQDLDLDNQ